MVLIQLIGEPTTQWCWLLRWANDSMVLSAQMSQWLNGVDYSGEPTTQWCWLLRWVQRLNGVDCSGETMTQWCWLLRWANNSIVLIAQVNALQPEKLEPTEHPTLEHYEIWPALFLTYGATLWNSLPGHIKSCGDLNSFKTCMQTWQDIPCKCNMCKWLFYTLCVLITILAIFIFLYLSIYLSIYWF